MTPSGVLIPFHDVPESWETIIQIVGVICQFRRSESEFKSLEL